MLSALLLMRHHYLVKMSFWKKNEIKFQEGSVLKYLYFRIYQSSLGFSVDHTHHIMVIVKEWFPTEKNRKVYTPFRTDSTYEQKLKHELPLAGDDLHKAEI